MTQIQKTRPLLNLITDGVLVLDQEGRVVLLNRSLEAMTGLSHEEVIGRQAASLPVYLAAGEKELPPGLAPPPECVSTPGSCYSRRLKLLRTGTGARTVQLRYRPLFCSEGTCKYLVGVFRDVTAEEQLSRALDQARPPENLGNLGYELAHQLLGPLNSIDIQSQVIGRLATKDAGPHQKELTEAVCMVRDEIRRLSSLLSETLQLQQPESNSLTSVSPQGLLSSLARLVEERAEDQGVSLLVDVAEGLPRLRIDATRLGSALLNLAMNSLEAMPEGGSLRLLARRDDDIVKISVADDGPGIPKAVVDQAFEMFYTTKAEGTGMGLPVARSIIEEHGGTLRLLDVEQGSELEISLPVP